jgi:hypothetical protein
MRARCEVRLPDGSQCGQPAWCIAPSGMIVCPAHDVAPESPAADHVMRQSPGLGDVARDTRNLPGEQCRTTEQWRWGIAA